MGDSEICRGGDVGFDVYGQLKTTRRLYARAERAIRRTERITLNLATAPVNQLRYAGFHILQGLEYVEAGNVANKAGDFANEKEDFENAEKCFAKARVDFDNARLNFAKANGHCKRSWLDAFECAVLYLLKSVSAFYADMVRNVVFLERHPEILAFQDEVKQIEDLFYSTALSQPMSVRERLRIIHGARRLGSIKRNVLRLFVEDSKCFGKGEDEHKRASKVARVIQDRQFLVSFAATTCGTILGTICFAMALYESSIGCDCRGWIVAGGVAFAIVLMVVTYFVAKIFLIPKTNGD